MIRRTLTCAVVLAVSALALPTPASAAVSKYIDTPRNEFGIAVANGYHAWAVDTAAHPFVDSIWVKPDGGPAYRVSSLKSGAFMGNIDVGNATFGDVLVYYAGGALGARQFDIRLWDLVNREPLVVPAGINTPKADERAVSISGNHLLFERVQPSGATRLWLYDLTAHTFTTVTHEGPQDGPIVTARLNGDYVVYGICQVSGRCTVFRYRISTASTVNAPSHGADYWPTVLPDGTVYFVRGSPRFCGHNTRLVRWTGVGAPTLVLELPETIEAATLDAADGGGSTTLYFTRIRCAASFASGIYRLPA